MKVSVAFITQQAQSIVICIFLKFVMAKLPKILHIIYLSKSFISNQNVLKSTTVTSKLLGTTLNQLHLSLILWFNQLYLQSFKFYMNYLKI